jgi:hypothetical protein
MSTEPGWMTVAASDPAYLGLASGRGANDPSMLLSFERPAWSVDARETTLQMT